MRAFEFKLRTAALTALAVFFMAFVPFFATAQGPVSFAPLVKELQPAVVNISTTPHGATRIGV